MTFLALNNFLHKKVCEFNWCQFINSIWRIIFVFFKVDFFNEDLEQFNKKINTPQMLANEQQMKEDLELMKQLREAGIRKKLEHLAKD